MMQKIPKSRVVVPFGVPPQSGWSLSLPYMTMSHAAHTSVGRRESRTRQEPPAVKPHALTNDGIPNGATRAQRASPPSSGLFDSAQLSSVRSRHSLDNGQVPAPGLLATDRISHVHRQHSIDYVGYVRSLCPQHTDL